MVEKLEQKWDNDRICLADIQISPFRFLGVLERNFDTWKRTRIYEHEELGIFIEGESNPLLDGYYAKGSRYKLMEADFRSEKSG